MSYLAAIEDIEPDKENVSEQLTDIKDTIRHLVDTALYIIPEGIIKERAKAYWHAHIVTALDDDNDYIGTSTCQMQDTIDEV